MSTEDDYTVKADDAVKADTVNDIDDEEPRPGLVRRTFKKTANFFVSPVKPFIAERKRNWRYIKDSTDILKQHVRTMRSNRDPHADGAPDMEDFEAVLAHWGISQDEVERVIRGVKVEICILLCFGFIGMVLLLLSSKHIPGLALIALSIVGMICRTWRLRVLQSRKFFGFKKWLIGGSNASST